jgi:hypothetical protein
MHTNTVKRDEPLEIVAEELDDIRVYSAGCASSWSGFGGGAPIQDKVVPAPSVDWPLQHALLPG